MSSFDDMMVHDANYPYSMREKVIENTEKIMVKDITFTSRLGNKELVTSAYLVIPKKLAEGGAPAVLFLHWLETDAEDSNRSQFLDYARKLGEMGVMSLLPDCFWSLDKEKFERNPDNYLKKWWKTNSQADQQLVHRQLVELKRAQDYLLSLNVNLEKVMLVGHDFGAMFGTLLSAFNAHEKQFSYRAYVMMAATPRFSDWFRFGSKLSDEELEKYCEEMEYLAPVVHAPTIDNILCQFANDDFYVPRSQAEEFFAAMKEPKEIRWYDAKHGMNATTFSDMYQWVQQQLELDQLFS